MENDPKEEADISSKQPERFAKMQTQYAEFLASLPGESWMVLGDMFELGDDAPRMHADVGSSIREAGIDRLYTHGDMSRRAAEEFGERAEWFESLDTLVDEVSGQLESGVNILVKGSRGMRMERVVEALRGNGGT